MRVNLKKLRSWLAMIVIGAFALGVNAQTDGSSKKQLAWELGSTLSLASVLHAESNDTGLVGRTFARAGSAATALGINLPPLPAKVGDKSKDSAAALYYLINSAGAPIGTILRQRLGPEHAAIFEISAKSNILLLLYGPGEKEAKTIAQVIRNRQGTAKLPTPMTEPLLRLIDGDASYADVKKELFALHDFAGMYIGVTEYSENGESMYQNKDFLGSAAQFSRAIALDPQGPEHYFSRGRAFLRLGKHKEAIADYTKVITLEGSSPSAAKNLPVVYHNRGLSYGLLGKNPLAIADLNMAIKLRPDYASAYKIRATVHKTMGNLRLANADLLAAEKLQPGITK